MEESCEHHSTHVCDCSSKPSLYTQSLTEMDFERGIWQAALDNNVKRITTILDKGGDPDARDGSGYTALVRKLVCGRYLFSYNSWAFLLFCSGDEMPYIFTRKCFIFLSPIPQPPTLLHVFHVIPYSFSHYASQWTSSVCGEGIGLGGSTLVRNVSTVLLKTVPTKPFFLKRKILKLFWEAVQIEICAACHTQSDGLCYVWNHAEQPLDINAHLFVSYKKHFLWSLVNSDSTSQHQKFFACLTKHCTRSESAWPSDREFFFHLREAKC